MPMNPSHRRANWLERLSDRYTSAAAVLSQELRPIHLPSLAVIRLPPQVRQGSLERAVWVSLAHTSFEQLRERWQTPAISVLQAILMIAGFETLSLKCLSFRLSIDVTR